MSFDEEDEIRFLGETIQSKTKKNAPATAIATAAADSPPPARGKKNTKRVSYLIEEEDDDANAPTDDKSSLFFKRMAESGKQMVMTAVRKPQTFRKISAKDKMACLSLIQNAKKIGLQKETLQQLELLSQCTDEGTMVDPFVVVYKSVYTGTCTIYLKEVVPLSIFLLAIVLKATFYVQVTPKSKTPEETFDLSTVQLKPFTKNVDEYNPTSNKAQPFNIEEAVQRKMQLRGDDASYMDQVTAYMHGIGPLSSFQVCEAEVLEPYLEAIKDIFANKLVVIKDAKKRKLEEQEDD
ncbi:MAG: hypothetical protein K2Q45_03870 [Nitrosomonas sp.]|nr:hypothetical protein [Nitrosomonas sp.]